MSHPPAVPAHTPAMPLASLTPGSRGVVRALELDPREQTWLRALGLFEGQHVTLLRRAPFGGPLHVRTGSGGEFAIDRDLARAIAVESEAP